MVICDRQKNRGWVLPEYKFTWSNTIFWTAWNFIKFVKDRDESEGIQYKKYYEKEPVQTRTLWFQGIYNDAGPVLSIIFEKALNKVFLDSVELNED